MTHDDDNEGPSVEETLRWMLGQPQGRAFIKHLSQSAGLMDDQFNPNNSQMSFSVGRRSVAVEVHQQARLADESRYLSHIGDLL